MSIDNNTSNLEQLMQLGIQTARQGNKQNARVIFQQVVDANGQNERAWLWLAAVTDDPSERFRYLNTVLKINPENQAALREMNKLKMKQQSTNSQVLLYGGIGLAIVLVLIALAFVLLAAS